jgi:proteasome lid subunit RPN8/RPN11
VTNPVVVEIPRELRRAIVAHAREAAPRECCGLLLGSTGRVQFAVRCPNRARGTTRYRVDPQVHFDLQRTVRRFVPAMAVLGAYHSHPSGPARPSPRDVAEANDPTWIHVIVGPVTSRPTVAAFRISGSAIEPLRIRWSPESGRS